MFAANKFMIKLNRSHRVGSCEDEASGAFQSMFFEMERVRKKAKLQALEAQSLLKSCQKSNRELKDMNERASQLLNKCNPLQAELQKIIWLDNRLSKLKENKPTVILESLHQ